MDKLPKKVVRGEAALAQSINDLIDYVKANTLRSGVGYLVKRSAAGTVLGMKKALGGGSVSAVVPKLVLVQGTAEDKYQVTSGTVNSQVPTMGGTALDAGTAPEITVTADVWVYVKVVGTFGAPDTYVVTIETEIIATKPTEAVSATAFTSYFLIGWVNFTSGTPDTFFMFNDHGGGNIGVESQGALNYWWRK